MIVLDTNVVSELMRASPDESVLGWVAAQPAASLHVTSVTQAEILHGILLLPAGKKRAAIQAAADAMFAAEFAGRILPFASGARPGGPSRSSMPRSRRSPYPHALRSLPATSRTSRAAVSR
jgi:hypothetical protein